MARVSTGRLKEVAQEDAFSPRAEARPPVPSDYVDRNRRAWDAWSAPTATRTRQEWETTELEWGLWNTPESELGLLAGMELRSEIVELGCGTAGVSAWLKRSGMHPVAVDFSRKQLERADDLQIEFEVFFPLIHANAEKVPYDRQSFDVAVSDYGASVWCDPVRWLPEARRLLRPNGQLIFFTPGPILRACTPDGGGEPGTHLLGDYFSPRYMDFGDGGVEFHLTYSGWARLLRDTGFVIEDIIETRPDPPATPRHPLVSTAWARRWPTEVIWVARAVAQPSLDSDERSSRLT